MMKRKVELGICLACVLFCLGGLAANGTLTARAGPARMTGALPFPVQPGDRLTVETAGARVKPMEIKVEKSTAAWIKASGGPWINIDNIVAVEKTTDDEEAEGGAGAKTNLLPRLAKTRHEVAEANIKNLTGAVEQYRMDNHLKLPSSLEELLKPNENNMNESYLESEDMLCDPWGNHYIYIVIGNDFVIRSLGADGREGGEGEDADISSKDRFERRYLR